MLRHRISLIKNSNQAKQGLDFTGLQNGAIHPSDIDAVLEFDNDALILIEVKRQGARIKKGQRLLLERLCDNWNTEKSIVLYCTHEFNDDGVDIPAELCTVYEVYHKGQWIVKNVKLKDALNALGDAWEIQKLKFE